MISLTTKSIWGDHSQVVDRGGKTADCVVGLSWVVGTLSIFHQLFTMRSVPQAKQLSGILLLGVITLQGSVAWTPISHHVFQRGALIQSSVPSKTILNEKPSPIDHDSGKSEESVDPTDESRRNLFAAALASANFGLINTVLGPNNAANALGGGYSGMDSSEAKRIDIFEKSVAFRGLYWYLHRTTRCLYNQRHGSPPWHRVWFCLGSRRTHCYQLSCGARCQVCTGSHFD